MTSEEMEASTSSLLKTLENMEYQWTELQTKLKKLKLKEAIKKKHRANEFMDEILKKCKEHSGPVVCPSDVKNLVKNTPDEKLLKSFLRQEV